jgi:predicted DNA-binding antitoxin AbrB/MazE fold protein
MDIVNAVFKHGAFQPEGPVKLAEGTRVRLAVELKDDATPGRSLSVEERRIIRCGVVERMKRNPLPADASPFRRDDMYDRG